MTKSKGTKGSAKMLAAGAKVAPKGTRSVARAAPSAKSAAKVAPSAKSAAKVVPSAKSAATVAPSAKSAATLEPTSLPPAASKLPPMETGPVPVVASSPPAAGEGLVIKKKKVKRGAPPMLPRRLPRRPLPPLEGSSPPAPKPTLTGSLHAPARVPEEDEKLRANVARLNTDLAKLKALKRNLQRQFWDAALILKELFDLSLYRAKNYPSWESFIEREVEKEVGIGRVHATDLLRIVKIFTREAADEFGQEKLREALRVLFPEPGGAPSRE